MAEQTTIEGGRRRPASNNANNNLENYAVKQATASDCGPASSDLKLLRATASKLSDRLGYHVDIVFSTASDEPNPEPKSSLLVFVVDESGSMSSTTEIEPGKHLSAHAACKQ